jgi:TonB-dependent starch-binding outer membrane protein SusC
MSCSRAAVPLCALLVLAGACAPAATRREAQSGAGVVTAEDIERQQNKPIEMVLQEKVPGLTIRRTSDGSLAFQIRGATTITGENAPPLFVLNDLPTEPGPGGTLPGVNPYDIESIKVLKGPDAAIYGMRGANGVIVIRTKKPGTRNP